MTAEVDPKYIAAVGEVLKDKNQPLAERFRSLFTLRNVGGQIAIDSISACFDDSSALLKHECAYCLGQLMDERAIPILVKVLRNHSEDTMVRHEAGEALGAIGSEDVLELLESFSNDAKLEVAETCQLAVDRIKWLHSKERHGEKLGMNPYMSVDPAPACEVEDTDKLRKVLMDEEQPLFKRYRAMFALRNIGDTESVLALGEGLKCQSALFRHEIAYVLGQIQHEAAVEDLKRNLTNTRENAMVRHECAEALGSIATKECMDVLHGYLQDSERVVRESCEVALDMCHHNSSGEFQYADGLDKVHEAVIVESTCK